MKADKARRMKECLEKGEERMKALVESVRGGVGEEGVRVEVVSCFPRKC